MFEQIVNEISSLVTTLRRNIAKAFVTNRKVGEISKRIVYLISQLEVPDII